MEMRKGKRTAKVRLTLTKRTVEGLEPTVKPWIAWDNKLTGFGVRIQPSGTKSCVDHDKLRNPVELWLAGGGKFHRKRRRRISAPSGVLPRWRRGIEAVRMPAAARNVLWVGVYTGMRLGEITSLRWERVNLKHRILRVDVYYGRGTNILRMRRKIKQQTLNERRRLHRQNNEFVTSMLPATQLRMP